MLQILVRKKALQQNQAMESHAVTCPQNPLYFVKLLPDKTS